MVNTQRYHHNLSTKNFNHTYLFVVKTYVEIYDKDSICLITSDISSNLDKCNIA